METTGKEIPDKFIRKSVKEAIAELKDGAYNTEFALPGDLSAEDLQSLLDLSFEVAITEHKGIFILTPNPDKPYIIYNEDYLERQRGSKLFLHTHYKRPEAVNDAPSFADIILTTETSPGTLTAVVHERGITQYGRPVKHPLTGSVLTPANSSSIFYEYERALGITLSARDQTAETPFLNHKYTPIERVKLAKEFVQKSGMLIAEANWTDGAGIQRMMGTINSRRK